MVYLFWSAGARDAYEGRTVFSRPGGGTRIGETLSERALRLFSDPAYPGLECAPFVAAAASGAASSVFDNGLPLGRDGLAARRPAGRPAAVAALRAPHRAARHRPTSTT